MTACAQKSFFVRRNIAPVFPWINNYPKGIKNSNSTAFNDGLGTCIKSDVWLSSSECLKKSFETHPETYPDEVSALIIIIMTYHDKSCKM